MIRHTLPPLKPSTQSFIRRVIETCKLRGLSWYNIQWTLLVETNDTKRLVRSQREGKVGLLFKFFHQPIFFPRGGWWVHSVYGTSYEDTCQETNGPSLFPRGGKFQRLSRSRIASVRSFRGKASFLGIRNFALRNVQFLSAPNIPTVTALSPFSFFFFFLFVFPLLGKRNSTARGWERGFLGY